MATPNLALFPSGRKATKLYSVLPTDGTGDFTVARGTGVTGKRHEINSDLKLEIIDADVPAFNYDSIGGCPVLNTEPQATNLITYPISFGNSYWTKSGATIEGDPSTAGSELVTNGVFATDTDWTKGTGWTIGSGVASYDAVTSFDVLSQSLVTTITQQYEISFEITSGTARIAFTEGTGQPILTGYANYGVGTHTLRGSSIQSGTALRIYALNTDGGLAFSIDNISVKELTGYSAPSVDFPTSAFKLVGDGTTSWKYIYKASFALTDTNYYTLSIFAKADTLDYIQLIASGATASNHQNFDLLNGVVGSGSGVSDSKIEALANGWYRCSMTVLATSTANTDLFINLANSATMARAASFSTSNGVYIFNAQLEAGSVATSPTFTDITLAAEGTTTGRLADVVNNLSATSYTDSLSGVLFAEISALGNEGTYRALSLNDAVGTNRVEMYYRPTAEQITFFVNIGGGNIINYTHTFTDVTTPHKVAIKWSVGDFGVFVNGVKVNSSNSTAVFASNVLTKISFTNSVGGEIFSGNTKQLQVYGTALTDAECITLTTL